MMKNILQVSSREEFRAWLEENAARESGCWVCVTRGTAKDGDFMYLDAVEEALCFGWIDSIHKLIDGRRMQRFTPRKNTVTGPSSTRNGSAGWNGSAL